MAKNNNGILSPLQLTAGAGLLTNTGITLGATFQTQLQEYQNTVVNDLRATVALANTANIGSALIQQLTTIGTNTIPSLADSVPNAFWDTNYPVAVANVYLIAKYPGVGMFSGEIANVGYQYLGSGDVGKFSQIFFAAQGYTNMSNQFINAAVNAYGNNYLGPTYNQAPSALHNMDNLMTGELTKLTYALTDFGADCADLGTMIDLGNLDNFGSPGALLEQLAAVTRTQGTLPCVERALLAQGLTLQDITDLATGNRYSLFNPDGLTENEYDTLQRLAYQALTQIAGDCLQQVLDTFGITTPNVTLMSDLLDPQLIFPRSYLSLTLADVNGPVLIYNDNGAVSDNIAPALNAGPSGCEQLAKIIPPAQAAANRAIGASWSQVKNISQVTLPALAVALTGA